MPKYRDLLTGFCILAVVALSARSTRMALAAEFGSDGGDAETSDHAPPDNGAGAKHYDLSARDNNEPQSNAAKDAGGDKGGKAEHPAAKDFGPIDTQITVWRRGPKGMADKVHEANRVKRAIKPVVRPKLLARRELPLTHLDHVPRNAVGAAIVRHEDAPPSPQAKIQIAVVPPIQPVNEASMARPAIVRQNATIAVAPSVVGHMAINGKTIGRPAYLPHPLGGPAKMIAGISGSMIQPKH